jgi:hypothetical protein
MVNSFATVAFSGGRLRAITAGKIYVGTGGRICHDKSAEGIRTHIRIIECLLPAITRHGGRLQITFAPPAFINADEEQGNIGQSSLSVDTLV